MTTNFGDLAAALDLREPDGRKDVPPGGGWQQGLPTLRGDKVTLRELRRADAPALLEAVSDVEVARFLSSPPASAAATERFIEWTRVQRAVGSYACFAVVPNHQERVAGIFQLRRLDPAFATAEWGFVLHSGSWGTGAFMDAATLVLRFAFGVCGVRRLEARVAAANQRGHGALRKVGAVKEGVIRRMLPKDDGYLDEVVWTLTATGAPALRPPSVARLH